MTKLKDFTRQSSGMLFTNGKFAILVLCCEVHGLSVCPSSGPDRAAHDGQKMLA